MGWVVGGSHTHYHITPVQDLGAGALMLNAWTGLLQFDADISQINLGVEIIRSLEIFLANQDTDCNIPPPFFHLCFHDQLVIIFQFQN